METEIRKPELDAFFLKMVAIIGMAMQHTVLVLGDVIPVGLHFPLQLAGGLTFPIMAFFLVEGYRYTSNVKRYMGRLFLWGLIAQVPHTMAFGTLVGVLTPNIMFTLFISLLGIVMYDRIKNRGLFVFLFVVLCIVSMIFEWGLIGPIVVLMFHIISPERRRRTLPPITAAVYNIVIIGLLGVIVMALIAVSPAVAELFADTVFTKPTEDINSFAAFAGIMFPIGSFLVPPLLLRYNGERGRSMKYLFYAFYPLHLLILALVAYAIGVSDLSLFAN